MTNITTPWGSLSLTPKPAANVTPGTDVIVSIIGSGTSQEFQPGEYVGFYNSSGPQVGDAANLWLPTVSAKTQATVDNPGTTGVSQPGGPVGGAVKIQLSAPSKLAQFYTSPMTYTLAPGDLVTVATGLF